MATISDVYELKTSADTSGLAAATAAVRQNNGAVAAARGAAAAAAAANNGTRRDGTTNLLRGWLGTADLWLERRMIARPYGPA